MNNQSGQYILRFRKSYWMNIWHPISLKYIYLFFDSRVSYLCVTWRNVLCRYRVIRFINQNKTRNKILLNLPVLRLFNVRIFPMFLNNMSKCLCCFISYNFYLLNSLLTQYLCSQCNMCILVITHYANCFPSQEAYHQYSNLV